MSTAAFTGRKWPVRKPGTPALSASERNVVSELATVAAASPLAMRRIWRLDRVISGFLGCQR